MIPGLFYLGKVKYFSGKKKIVQEESINIKRLNRLGENDASKIFLQKILDKDPSYTDAHILMAQVTKTKFK